MKKITITLLTVVLVAVGAVFAIGQTGEGDTTNGKAYFGKQGQKGHFGKRGKRGKRKMMRLMRHLDLTDEQKAQMKAIRQSSRETIKPLRQQLRANKKALNELTANGNFDEAEVTALATQQGALMSQVIVQKQKTKTEIYNVLTSEQQAKLAELKQQRAERRAAFKAKMKAAKENQ